MDAAPVVMVGMELWWLWWCCLCCGVLPLRCFLVIELRPILPLICSDVWASSVEETRSWARSSRLVCSGIDEELSDALVASTGMVCRTEKVLSSSFSILGSASGARPRAMEPGVFIIAGNALLTDATCADADGRPSLLLGGFDC